MKITIKIDHGPLLRRGEGWHCKRAFTSFDELIESEHMKQRYETRMRNSVYDEVKRSKVLFYSRG